jgi:hypothetical protein
MTIREDEVKFYLMTENCNCRADFNSLTFDIWLNQSNQSISSSFDSSLSWIESHIDNFSDIDYRFWSLHQLLWWLFAWCDNFDLWIVSIARQLTNDFQKSSIFLMLFEIPWLVVSAFFINRGLAYQYFHSRTSRISSKIAWFALNDFESYIEEWLHE